jgi:cytidine deaminase
VPAKPVSASRRPQQPSVDWRALTRAAALVRRSAYAPYSKFRVGAALLTGSGETYVGANVENASYGLCLCAERVAVARAVNAGEKRFVALVVMTQSVPPSPPCGLCLQTLREFAEDLPMRLVNPRGAVQETTLRTLFPGAFTRALLES